MVKGKRPKESHKEPPKESPSVQQSSNATGGVQTLAPKKKKEKPSSGHGALPATPAHPPPIKNAPSSSGTQLMPLQKSPPKVGTKKEQKAKEEDEASSESSQEGELDTSLEEKGNKKKGQVSLATSPLEQVSEGDKEDAMSSEGSLPAIGSSAENSPTTSVDLLAEFMGDEKDDSPSSAPDDLPTFLKKMGEIKTLLFQWQDAKEFPEINTIEEISDDEIDQYLERVLKDSHKWKDTEGVGKTLQEIDIEDKVIRSNDRFLRMVYLRLGQALHLHTEVAKAHAATMKEAAFTWQQRAIKLIEEATCNVQIDNKKSIKDIQMEAQKTTLDLNKQLQELTKKHSDLQTEHSFVCAQLALKEESKVEQESSASDNRITQLTLELGTQRQSNENLRKQFQELFSSFAAYRAGHLKNSIELNVKEKRENSSVQNNAGSVQIFTSPSWGNTKREFTPSSSDCDHKGGDSSTSQSDHGWGNPPARKKVHRRTPPREDRRSDRQRSPPKSKFSNRDTNWKKRPASPLKEGQPAKRNMSRDAWIAGGKEAISRWSGVDQLRRTIRSYGLSDIKNMIARVKEAETDIRELFYRSTIPYQHRANEEHSKYLILQKELGIPGIDEIDDEKRPVSLNFYYAKVVKMCYDHQNTLKMKETTDKAIMGVYEQVIEHNKKEPNPYEHYDDSYIISNSVSSLGEHTRERIDHKKACYRLWLQEKDMLDYHKMRYDFFNKAFLQRDMQHLGPMVGLLDKEDVMEINEDLRNTKLMLGKEVEKPTKLFKDIYARVYKEHYQEIIEQIETFATYGTPIEKFLNCNDIDTAFYIDTGANTQEEF